MATRTVSPAVSPAVSPEGAGGPGGEGQVFLVATGSDRRRHLVGPFVSAEAAARDGAAWARDEPDLRLDVWFVGCITPVHQVCATCTVEGTR